MLSHACGSCGKVLDGASRTYSQDLRMWIAQCGRCGFAVRWSPRAAREPSRVWARLRALNLRLGVATAGIQFGGVVLLLAGGLLVAAARKDPSGASWNELVDLFAPTAAVASLAGILIGASAATIAPFRPAVRTLAAAWLATLLFAVLLWLVVLTANASPSSVRSLIRSEFRLLSRIPLEASTIAAIMVLASAVGAIVLRAVIGAGFARVVRRTARLRRQTLVTVHAANRPPAPTWSTPS